MRQAKQAVRDEALIRQHVFSRGIKARCLLRFGVEPQEMSSLSQRKGGVSALV